MVYKLIRVSGAVNFSFLSTIFDTVGQLRIFSLIFAGNTRSSDLIG